MLLSTSGGILVRVRPNEELCTRESVQCPGRRQGAIRRSNPSRYHGREKHLRMLDDAKGIRTGNCTGRPEGRPMLRHRANPTGILKTSPDVGRVTDAETGWRENIYSIEPRQPALPTSSFEDKGPSFQITFS